MILPIYLYGHPVLRKVSEDITPEYPKLKEVIENMKETMYDSDGIGIAAPQVGLNIRLICIDVDVLKDSFPELEGKYRKGGAVRAGKLGRWGSQSVRL